MRRNRRPTESGPSDDQLEAVVAISIRAARKHGADPFEAEEVAQISAMKIIARWNSPGSIKARRRGERGWGNFIATVARRTHLDLLRSKERRTKRERRAAGVGPDLPQPRPGVQRSRPRDASGIERFLGRKAILDLAAGLPTERQRACIIMIFHDGMTVDEVSEELGLKPQTVRLHLRQALRFLRGQLG